MKKITYLLGIVVLFSGVFVYASNNWQEPTSSPPEENVPAPLNVGDSTQTKRGDLAVEGNISAHEPTAGDHVVNKDYVDALSGGGFTYTVYGQDDCASGDERVYSGDLVFPVVGHDAVEPLCANFRGGQWTLIESGDSSVNFYKLDTYWASEGYVDNDQVIAEWGGYGNSDDFECALCIREY